LSLFNKVFSGLKWTTAEAVIKAFIQVLRVFILTKILSPTDFGIMALVMVVTGFSQIFIDFGISNAIIYKKDTSSNELSSLYWVNVFFGLVIFGIVFLLRDIFSDYIFNEPYLSDFLKYISFVFILSGFTTQYNALLRKNLKFQSIAIINIISNFVGFIVTLVLAYQGKGVYSLVVGYISLIIIKSILTILFGLKYHIPHIYFKYSDIKFYLNFGGFQLSERIVNYLRQNGDSILIGVFLTTETLGLYNVAKILVRKPIDLIQSIFGKMAFPVFTSIKSDKQLIKWAVTLNKIVFLAISPVMLLLIVFSESVIYYFYGLKWIAAAPFLKLLSILFALELLRTTFGPLLLSKGKAKLSFIFTLWYSFLVLATLGVLLQYSIIHALFGLIMVELLVIQIMNFHFVMKPILNFSIKKYIQIILEVFTPLLVSCIITSIGYYFFSNMILIYNNILLYFLGLSVGAVIYYILNKEIVIFLKNKRNQIKK
tara:strand:+ start:454 stop:1905 length:1452 start_codon:yes stop_codon:yes gene_type:complete